MINEVTKKLMKCRALTESIKNLHYFSIYNFDDVKMIFKRIKIN